jgi:bifunctional DNA-binding transcriptional regulator/antitoxin component of YhaV-PrlF toxin-antitoxin module
MADGDGPMRATGIVRRIDGELVIVLPASMLAALGFAEGDRLDATSAESKDVRLAKEAGHFERAMHFAEETMVRYEATLRELAK